MLKNISDTHGKELGGTVIWALPAGTPREEAGGHQPEGAEYSGVPEKGNGIEDCLPTHPQ